MSTPQMRPAGESSRPMARRFMFNREKLKALKPPAKGRSYVYDEKVRQLAYMLTDNGATSWLWIGRIRGHVHPQRYKIASGDDMTLEQARDRAAKITAGAIEGIDPAATVRALAGVKTFGEVFKWFMEEWAKPRKKTWKQDQDFHDKHLAQLDGQKIDAISVEDMRRIHSAIGKTAPTHANRILALASTVFNKARKAGFLRGQNPAAGVDRFPEVERERFLQADELPKFITALQQEPSETMRDFFELSLWTGARRSNVLSMRWDEINDDRKLWTIPAAKAKADKAIDVPLSEPALVVLRRRKTFTGRSPWVFPANSKSGHLQEPKNAWAKLLTRAGLKDVRIHDLRRTFGSWQAGTGASLPVIGKSLGHRNVKTTSIYARLSLDPVRAAVDTATAAMQAAIAAAPAAEKAGEGQDEPAKPVKRKTRGGKSKGSERRRKS